MDWGPPGSSVHGILLARILEWVAISFSRGSSRPRELGFPALQAGSLPSEPPGKPRQTFVTNINSECLRSWHSHIGPRESWPFSDGIPQTSRGLAKCWLLGLRLPPAGRTDLEAACCAGSPPPRTLRSSHGSTSCPALRPGPHSTPALPLPAVPTWQCSWLRLKWKPDPPSSLLSQHRWIARICCQVGTEAPSSDFQAE